MNNLVKLWAFLKRDFMSEVFEETRDHSPLAAKINDDFQAKLRDIGAWRGAAEVEFSNQRNRVLGLI